MKPMRFNLKKCDLELCFDRLILDVKDDFFLDPFLFRDLNLEKRDIVNSCISKIKETLKQKRVYTPKEFYHCDVPKKNFVVRHAVIIHPEDRLIHHIILHHLIPHIEGKLSSKGYSYKVSNNSAKKLFPQPTKLWLKFKSDITKHFEENKDYEYLVSTDIAGFFEHISLIDFKKQLYSLTELKNNEVIDFMNNYLKSLSYSHNSNSGVPQNYDPSSYLCSAFLDFFDNDLDSKGLIHFRYVDDIKIACKTIDDAKKAIITSIQSLRAKTLNLSTAKTEIWNINDQKFVEFTEDFPELLIQIDVSFENKIKSEIDDQLDKLVELTKKIMKHNNFNDKLFRACIWRIVKGHYFKNIEQINLRTICNKCLFLMESMPDKSDSFLRLLELEKEKKYVQDGLLSLLLNVVYEWQEMLIWQSLTRCKKIKNPDLIKLAKGRIRNEEYFHFARNSAILFLGKHGDYQDKVYLASKLNQPSSVYTKRAILIALQEYPDVKHIYNKVRDNEKELILKSLVKYLGRFNKPQYVSEKDNIASIDTFIS